MEQLKILNKEKHMRTETKSDKGAKPEWWLRTAGYLFFGGFAIIAVYSLGIPNARAYGFVAGGFALTGIALLTFANAIKGLRYLHRLNDRIDGITSELEKIKTTIINRKDIREGDIHH